MWCGIIQPSWAGTSPEANDVCGLRGDDKDRCRGAKHITPAGTRLGSRLRHRQLPIEAITRGSRMHPIHSHPGCWTHLVRRAMTRRCWTGKRITTWVVKRGSCLACQTCVSTANTSQREVSHPRTLRFTAARRARAGATNTPPTVTPPQASPTNVYPHSPHPPTHGVPPIHPTAAIHAPA
jgi:hypothetical protein